MLTVKKKIIERITEKHRTATILCCKPKSGRGRFVGQASHIWSLDGSTIKWQPKCSVHMY